MRKLILGAVTISFGALGLAGVPNRIVYQGRLSKTGVAVSGGHTFSARIYPASDPSQSLWQSGNMAINLPATGEFSLVLEINNNIDWLNADPKLEITVDGEKLSPDEAFGTNPYSFAAKTVGAGGVNTAAIQDGAVTDVKVSTISAAKIMLPGTASAMTVWQSTVAGQQDKINAAKIYGTIPALPAAHGASHVAGNTDPIANLQSTQVAGTAVVRSTGVTQVIQAATTVPGLDLKGNAGSGSKILRIFDSGTLGQAGSTPQEQAYFDKDANLISNRSVTTLNLAVTGSLGVGTATPTAKLEISGGNLKVSGGIDAGFVSAASATISGNLSAANVSFSSQSSARVMPAGPVTVPNGATLTVDFGVKTFDHQNEFNLGSDRFVAQSAGQYLVTAQVNMANVQPGTMYRVYIEKNGADFLVRSVHSSNGSDFTVSITDIIFLQAGDSIGLMFLNSGTAPVTYSSGHTFLAIHKLS